MEQKSQADDLAAELKQRLHNADEALRAAEDRVASLKTALGEVGATAATASAAAAAAREVAVEESKSIAGLAAERAVDAIVAAVVATVEERQHSRDAIDNALRASEAAWGDRITAITEQERNRAEDRLNAAELASSAAVQASEQRASSAETELSRQRGSHSQEIAAIAAIAAGAAARQEETAAAARSKEKEIEHLKGEVGRARADETMARNETAAARSKVLELEREMETSRRAHASFRERTELRLESLRLAVEDEELEQGAQVHRWCSYTLQLLFVTHKRPRTSSYGTILEIDQTSNALVLLECFDGRRASVVSARWHQQLHAGRNLWVHRGQFCQSLPNQTDRENHRVHDSPCSMASTHRKMATTECADNEKTMSTHPPQIRMGHKTAKGVILVQNPNPLFWISTFAR